MQSSFKKQSGITFWGICFVLAFIGLVVLFTLRAFPLYNEKFQVQAAMKSVVSQPDAAKFKGSEARKYFLRNLQVTNIDRFDDRNVKDYVQVIKSKTRGEPNILHVSYEARNKLFDNLELLMVFDEKMPLRGPGAGE